MNDSKQDDKPRSAWREAVKRWFYAPYQGALAGSLRSQAYLAALGVPQDRIALGYDGLSVARLRREAGRQSVTFDQRNFLIVARLVPAKNLVTALAAYALYRQHQQVLGQPVRGLEICGHGPLADFLRQEIHCRQLSAEVQLHGWLPGPQIAQKMRHSVALILPSTLEPFGQVVAEAMAVGLPVLVSEACGACDELVRDGVNGFTFAPHDVDRLAALMHDVSAETHRWQDLSAGSAHLLELADAQRFAHGVAALLTPQPLPA